MPEIDDTDGTANDDQQDGGAAATEALGDAGKQALDRMKAERNEAIKARRTAEQNLEKARAASMSDAEKAIAEAEARGRTAAATDYGKKLAKARLDAAAAKRNPDFDTSALDYVDLGRFIGEDGEPDSKAIAAAVDRLVPAPNGAPSFDGGARRTPPKGSDMNSIIRQAAGLG